MGKPYVVCTHCGRRRKCKCQSIDIQADKIRDVDIQATAKAVLAATKKAFEKPAVAKDYQRWLADRRGNLTDTQ